MQRLVTRLILQQLQWNQAAFLAILGSFDYTGLRFT